MSLSLAEIISPELPYLRRFARALTGSQQRGDTYVAAMLESLVADNSILDRTMPPRLASYQALLKVWNTLPLNQIQEPPSSEAADRRVEQIASLPRQAFLLTAVEDLTPAEAGRIMNLSAAEIRDLIDDASRQIASQITADVLIIEDEPLIALDIETLVSDLGHSVVGIARTRAEARAIAAERRPGLILADIQLADGSSGIDAVADIIADLEIPVIFITAYPERLLTGERPEPAFLISKPFSNNMVKAVVSQALFFEMKAKHRNGAAMGAARVQ